MTGPTIDQLITAARNQAKENGVPGEPLLVVDPAEIFFNKERAEVYVSLKGLAAAFGLLKS